MLQTKINNFFLFFLILSTHAVTAIREKLSIVSFLGFVKHADIVFDSNFRERDDAYKPFYMLKQTLMNIGYDVVIAKSPNDCKNSKIILFFGPDITAANQIANIRAKKMYFSFEPPIINSNYLNPNYKNLFDKMFLLLDELADNKKSFRMFYPQNNLNLIEDIIPFNKKKFCTLIFGYHTSADSRALYSQRINIIKFFEQQHPNDFEFYGHGWPSGYKSYKGGITNKVPCLKNYKFCICYENSRHNGYITEKIFDSMIAGCVPIYLGAYNIKNFIPENCFIDRSKFKSNEDLYNFLKSIDEKKYQVYLTNIKNFFKSEKAKLFSIDNFINLVLFNIKN